MTSAMTTQPLRARLGAWIESPPTQNVLIALILFNALVLGAETSKPIMDAWGPVLIAIDHAILAVFVVEIAIRIAAHGLRFFRDPWSVFDFVVVAIALVPASEAFSVLRALRVPSSSATTRSSARNRTHQVLH